MITVEQNDWFLLLELFWIYYFAGQNWGHFFSRFISSEVDFLSFGIQKKLILFAFKVNYTVYISGWLNLPHFCLYYIQQVPLHTHKNNTLFFSR